MEACNIPGIIIVRVGPMSVRKVCVEMWQSVSCFVESCWVWRKVGRISGMEVGRDTTGATALLLHGEHTGLHRYLFHTAVPNLSVSAGSVLLFSLDSSLLNRI